MGHNFPLAPAFPQFDQRSTTLLGATYFQRDLLEIIRMTAIYEVLGHTLTAEKMENQDIARIMATPYYLFNDADNPTPSAGIGRAGLISISDLNRATQKGPQEVIELLARVADQVLWRATQQDLANEEELRSLHGTLDEQGVRYILSAISEDPNRIITRHETALGKTPEPKRAAETSEDLWAVIVGGHLEKVAREAQDGLPISGHWAMESYVRAVASQSNVNMHLLNDAVSSLLDDKSKQDRSDLLADVVKKTSRTASQSDIHRFVDDVSGWKAETITGLLMEDEKSSLFQTAQSYWVISTKGGEDNYATAIDLLLRSQQFDMMSANLNKTEAEITQDNEINIRWMERQGRYGLNADMIDKIKRNYAELAVLWSNDEKADPISVLDYVFSTDDQKKYIQDKPAKWRRAVFSGQGLGEISKDFLVHTILAAQEQDPRMIMRILERMESLDKRGLEWIETAFSDERVRNLLLAEQPAFPGYQHKRFFNDLKKGVVMPHVQSALDELWFSQQSLSPLDPEFDKLWNERTEGGDEWQTQVNRQSLARWRRAALMSQVDNDRKTPSPKM